MPRKEIPGNRQPVDQYRKQIGKQDTKKNKADLQEIKKKAEAKQSASSSYKDVALMVLALTIVVFAVYILLYFFLSSG